MSHAASPDRDIFTRERARERGYTWRVRGTVPFYYVNSGQGLDGTALRRADAESMGENLVQFDRATVCNCYGAATHGRDDVCPEGVWRYYLARCLVRFPSQQDARAFIRAVRDEEGPQDFDFALVYLSGMEGLDFERRRTRDDLVELFREKWEESA